MICLKGMARNPRKNRAQRRSRKKQPTDSPPLEVRGLKLTPGEGAMGEIIEGDLSGMKIFARHLLPDELARVQPTRIHKRHAFGDVLEILSPSVMRQDASCPDAQTCGGCSWLHVKRILAHRAKTDFVRNAMERIWPDFDVEVRFLPHPSPTHSRARARMYLSKSGLSFHRYHSDKTLVPQQCRALHSMIEGSRVELSAWLSDLGLKGSSVLIQVGLPLDSDVWALYISVKAPRSTTLPSTDHELFRDGIRPNVLNGFRVDLGSGQKSEDRLTWGEQSFRWPVKIRDQELFVEHKIGSFTQSDPDANQVLIDELVRVLDSIRPAPETAVELYSGAGNLTNAWPTSLRQLTTFEYAPGMVPLIQKNVLLPNLEELDAVQADLSGGLNSEIVQEMTPPDVLLLDPPREGARSVAQDIGQWGPAYVVYVSCNPATLSRDLQELAQSGYKARDVRAIDMFPNTPHVETIVLLELSI